MIYTGLLGYDFPMQPIYEMRPQRKPVSGGMHNCASRYRRGNKRLAATATLSCDRSLFFFFFFGRQEECFLPSHSPTALEPKMTLAGNWSETTTSSNFLRKCKGSCVLSHLGARKTSSISCSWQQYQRSFRQGDNTQDGPQT